MSQRTKLLKLLKKSGYKLVRSKKHLVFKNETGKTIIVPNHNDICKHIVKSVIKKVG